MGLQDILSNPELFASKALKVLDKDGQLVNLNWNPVQKQIYPRLTGRDLILKARQMGVTSQIQGEVFRRLITRSTRALSLSKDDNGTTYLREMQDRFHKNLPSPKPIRKYSNAQVTTFPELDSSHFIGTAGSSEVGRGSSFNFIHGTEVAFWKDAEKLLAGALQAGNPYIVLESTANGAQGWFYEQCMDAIAGRGDWNLIFIPYTEFPEYQVEGWVDRKKAELKRLFQQEYPATALEAFLASNTGYFSDLDFTKIFTAPHNTQRIQGHAYSAGLDFGQSNDYTFMPVFDRTDRRQVDYLHINKMAWGQQRIEIRRMYNKWGLTSIRAEANSIGSVNIEELEADGVEIERFTTTNKSKNEIMQRFHEELENGLTLIDWDVQKSEMVNMTSKQTPSGLWSISADIGHDDTVIGNALAVSARIRPLQARSWQ